MEMYLFFDSKVLDWRGGKSHQGFVSQKTTYITDFRYELRTKDRSKTKHLYHDWLGFLL